MLVTLLEVPMAAHSNEASKVFCPQTTSPMNRLAAHSTHNDGYLPAELHELILCSIKDDPHLLSIYSAVCRPWESAAWPYRQSHFRCVTLTREKVASSRDFFRSAPRIGPFIQTLVIKYTSPQDIQRVEEVDLQFAEGLPNVTTLRVDALPITPTLIASMSELAAHVRQLDTGILLAEDPAHFVDFVRSFTNLEKLYVRERPGLMSPIPADGTWQAESISDLTVSLCTRSTWVAYCLPHISLRACSRGCELECTHHCFWRASNPQDNANGSFRRTRPASR